MKYSHSSAAGGSTLVVTLVVVAALSLMAAHTLTRAVPRVQMAYQNAAWQEARVAAEAGIDTAMNDVLINATGFQPGTWTGWKEETTSTPAGGGGSVLQSVLQTIQTTTTTLSGSGTPGGSLLVTTTNALNGLLRGILTPSPATGGTFASGSSVPASAPLYLDNIRLSAVTGVPTEVDIRLWALQPNLNPNARWFRIRCMATCALPPTAQSPPANLDARLRRFSLRSVRPALRKDDVGVPSTIPLPNVSRTIEVLVEPILSFELALWTGEGLALPLSGPWDIDSFDSTDPNKSGPDRSYPGRGSRQVQVNGDIASSLEPASNLTYGPAIAANGTRVHGAVATNGGDDSSTKEHENVSGTFGLDPARIHDDFSRQMVPLIRPAGEFMPPPGAGAFVTGPETAPAIYSVHGSLTELSITPPASATKGVVVIMIDGNLDLTQPLVIPPSVIAVLFVRGQITFRDNVNFGPSNSNRARQLLIFGDGASTQRQTLRVFGPASVCAAFYGPRADAILDGSVHWIGSLNALSFRAANGGDGGIHYDESLATVGPTIGFRIARYIEDVRE